mmetsp:Transcript_61599/g.133332  ORF Transcript_61599/g.133332 Transcript_61599/m.133332 type:complete len:511 (-) Transcript_61599:351-1883(-)|eukprot:CAMPEP_0170595760 /NCGR_PEP_ID=MMETSP0224-20130122/14737_1 /TAXON_ID=285029 /ORGANISM="Togula jolla, Strain CCCM 725" /LENGTH=510 /DNA_ID=CAMNT_0010919969 /DNA_START=104 /DNA_END=1636 /DNA_ORIENTATION=-
MAAGMLEGPELKGGTEAGAADIGLEKMKVRIMAEIEAKLSQKEGSLWRRGQVEIRRLQLQQEKVNSYVALLQDRQASLLTENQKIRGALMEVTEKFELVVKEMRQVLRTQDIGRQDQLSPTPSVVSTSASEARDESGYQATPTPASSFAGGSAERIPDRARLPTGLQCPPTWDSMGMAGLGLVMDGEESLEPLNYFNTPTRSTGTGYTEDPATRSDAGFWRATPSPSPAVLSLASVLPSASPVSGVSMTPNPSPGTGVKVSQRLHLAECLDQPSDGTYASLVSGIPPSLVNAQTAAQRHSEPASWAASPERELISVEINKEPGLSTLGIEVLEFDKSCIRVEGIDDHGLIGRHNMRQDSEATMVLVGDRIIEANGIRNDHDKILKECKARQRLALKLLRDTKAPAADVGIGPKSTDSPPMASTAPQGHSGEETAKASGSPLPTRLRPEASVFVPSSAQKEASSSAKLPAPPGLETGPAGWFEKSLSSPTNKVASDQGDKAEQEVKRALFP